MRGDIAVQTDHPGSAMLPVVLEKNRLAASMSRRLFTMLPPALSRGAEPEAGENGRDPGRTGSWERSAITRQTSPPSGPETGSTRPSSPYTGLWCRHCPDQANQESTATSPHLFSPVPAVEFHDSDGVLEEPLVPGRRLRLNGDVGR